MTIDKEAFKGFLSEAQARIEKSLAHWLPEDCTHPGYLHEAMRYAVLDGGKRIRPVLVYAAGQAAGAETATLDGPACSVELIHAYSLVHDDLPAMDNDDLRRGKPTCHKAFDEATALLAGDALQPLAFHILASDPAMNPDPAIRLCMIDTLATASGSLGMAGGQAIDLASVGQTLTLQELEKMHRLKTGALIRASVMLGALSAEQTEEGTLDHLDRYADCVGLAFQVRDDILDVEADTETLGKTQGKDQAQDKPTYPSILGMQGAKQQAIALHKEALDHLQPLGAKAEPLRWISEYIVERGS